MKVSSIKLSPSLARRFTDEQHKQWTRCTAFQQRVYTATYRIPKGETRSYGWVARQAGNPKASRAVGQALHVNPFAPLIPCHRVVKSDGSLGGFAKGPQAKRRLLAGEGVEV